MSAADIAPALALSAIYLVGLSWCIAACLAVRP